jgi:hypothetical protein
MPLLRNILITCGAFWFSLLTVVWFSLPFIRLGNGIIYGGGVLGGIAEGLMTSMDRALAAALAGALVTAFVISPKPQLWAFVAAAMYIDHPPVRSHWVLPPTSRDR